ncbi:MAG: acetyl-CoA hydrolase/transferase C-terminal domain-containing protein [Actinomycetota bacterium]|nr:acetyl-CoA hydrolase/transferase C-terminal domain-containing protein [Actinomycetota bacterium]
MRVITPEQLAGIYDGLPDNPRVVTSGNFATPFVLLNALDAHVSQYRLHLLNAQAGLPSRPGVHYETAFIGAGMRGYSDLEYIPCRLSLVPVLFRDHYRPDVVLLHTSTRRFDTVSLGTEVNVLPAAIESARAHGGLVIAQANPQMPYTYGDAQLYEHEIDYLVEVDEPLPTHPPLEISAVSKEIGDRIASVVHDGSTLQLGIGAVPDAVLSGLTGHAGLRIWTEMFSDGVLALHKAGALDPEIPLTASFLFGTKELYEWVNLNRSIRMMRTERVNDPGAIARQAQMTSVNAALQVDLFDQANASRMNGRIFSGFGGATDFMVGALHSRGGRSFIALPSWHPKANVSTIVPRITEPVTSFQHSAVVTENGIADVFGRSQSEQASNIITYAAHPSVREELTSKAKEFNLI